MDVLRPEIERALRRAYPGADPDHVTDAAVDALLEGRRNLGRFDPTRGVSFAQYVVLAARRNLLDRLATERRRRSREELGLWLDDERRTEVVATALGLDDASADARRAAVKRVRDRIFQRLRRLGGALGRRAPLPVPARPAASRKRDDG